MALGVAGRSGIVSARILALLARAHLPATFFMVGRQAAAHPRLVRRVAQAGQVVGGHTWNHARLDRLPSARVAAEVDCTNQLLARLAGRPVQLVRPPDGAYDRGVVDRLAARGLQLILWTVDSRDWAHPGVHQIVATVVRELRAGAISCSTMAAATALKPWPRCRSCCGSCTPAAIGPSHSPPVQLRRPNGWASKRPGQSHSGRPGGECGV